MSSRMPKQSQHPPQAHTTSERELSTSLYRIRVREIWSFVLNQRLSFWFLCLYLFMEYVRPQQIYKEIDVLPWAQIFIILTGLFLLLEGKKFRPWQPADSAFVAFLACILISIPFAWNPKMSLPMLYVPFSWFVIYWLITNIIDSEARYLVF